MEELKKLLEKQGEAFTEFKAANDARLKAIEEKGYAPADVEQKVNDINIKITELSAEIKAVALKANRPEPAKGEQTTEQREHKAALMNYVRKGEEAGLRDLERKVMTVGSDPGGGYLVGDEIESGIDTVVTANVAMMRLADVRTIGAAAYKRRVRTSGAGYGWVGETQAPTETTTPQFEMLKFEPGTIYAEPQISQDLLEDAEFDVETDLNQTLDEDFTAGIGEALITGNGINKPRGITSYAMVANSSYAWGSVGYVASGVAASLGKADALIDLVHALKPAYRGNGQFLMNDLTLAALRKFKTGDGNYLWQPGLQLGVPDRLIGYPCNTDDYMPDVAADSYSIAFGDYKKAYIVVRRRGMALLRDPFTAKPFTKFYTTLRIGGGIKHFEAVKFLKCAAA
jgi:HK97 family phage major capsid protein